MRCIGPLALVVLLGSLPAACFRAGLSAVGDEVDAAADGDLDGDGDGDGDVDGDGDGDGHVDGDVDGVAACGDRVCEGGEDAATCPADCPGTCGDGLCTHAETAASCPADCYAALALGTGWDHSCALIEGGTMRCWGKDRDGQLGYGDTASRGDTPETVPALVGDVALFGVVGLAVGAVHTCALLDGGDVRCWGANFDGQLGYGDMVGRGDAPSTTPDLLPDVAVAGVVAQVTAGTAHSCAVLDDGRVQCWGSGANGRLGTGDTAPQLAPGPVVVGGGDFVEASAGASFTCGLTARGEVRCWGSNLRGQLGIGVSFGERLDSSAATPLPAAATRVAAGGDHACAVLVGGDLYCWGSDEVGEVGDGGPIGDSVPDPALVATGVADVSLGELHTCAVLVDGTARCWGAGTFGRLGYDDTVDRSTVPVSGVPVCTARECVATLAAGGSHTCALTIAGAVRCWGSGGAGQLGYGDSSDVGDGVGPSIVAAGDVPLVTPP